MKRIGAREVRRRTVWMRTAVAGITALVAGLLAAACTSAPAPGAPTRTGVGLEAALSRADTFRVEGVAPGVRHAYAWDARGPWAIHVLEVRRGRCGPRLEARKAGPPLAARAGTRRLGAGEVAAVNADFFRIPEGTTVGAHVQDGRVLMGPGEWPVLAVADTALWIGRAVLAGHGARGADTIALAQVNRDAGASGGLALYTGWYGAESPDDGSGVAVRVRRVAADAGVVVARAVHGGVALDPRHVAFHGRGRAAVWLRRLEVGDTVRWRAAVVGARGGAPGREVVGGFPLLLREGRIPAELDSVARPSFGRKRHPRTAVGVADGGRTIFLVTVDGRQTPYSDGMSLRELARLLRDLGATEALNLDGGGSTTMVVRERIVNRLSDEEGERPVGNALVVTAGRCSRTTEEVGRR